MNDKSCGFFKVSWKLVWALKKTLLNEDLNFVTFFQHLLELYLD